MTSLFVRGSAVVLFIAGVWCFLFAEDLQPLACPKTVAAKPNWFRGLVTPRPSGTLLISVEMQPSEIGCTGRPAEITVPSNQQVHLKITYPKAGYTCSTTLEESKAPENPNAAQDLISAFAKAGVLGFDVIREVPKLEAQFDRDLPPLKSTVMTATAQCKRSTDDRSPASAQTQQALVQKVSITYQNPPHVTASAGFVIASGVRSYGVKTTTTGTGSSGVTNTQNTVAVTSSPGAQVVPFGFANLYWIGSQTTHIDSQFGFGVNPNLSSARVEFFASPFAFSWHNVYFSPGVHIGQHEQLANGFALGDVLPNGIKVPISWKYYAGFGFSVSYNLHPLIKGKSGS